MSYDLEVMADPGYSKTVTLAEAVGVVVSLPGIRQTGTRSFVFDRLDAGVYFTIDLCDMSEDGAADGTPGVVNCLAISAPYGPAVPVAIDAAAELAAKLTWRVFDEDAGAEVVSSEQAQGAGVRLQRSASQPPTLGQLFQLEMWNHSLPAMVTCLVLAAVATGAVVVEARVAKDAIGHRMALGVSVGGIGLMLLKALYQALLLRHTGAK